MSIKRALLSVLGFAVVLGVAAPANAQYHHHHRHCYYHHHHRVCRY